MWARDFAMGSFVLDLVAENKMNASVACVTEFISLWRVRLGHVNIPSIRRLTQLSLIPTFSNCVVDKCEIYGG